MSVWAYFAGRDHSPVGTGEAPAVQDPNRIRRRRQFAGSDGPVGSALGRAREAVRHTAAGSKRIAKHAITVGVVVDIPQGARLSCGARHEPIVSARLQAIPSVASRPGLTKRLELTLAAVVRLCFSDRRHRPIFVGT
jgi:hypothetical protein